MTKNEENLSEFNFCRVNFHGRVFLKIYPIDAEIPQNAEILDIITIWHELLTCNKIRDVWEKYRLNQEYIDKIFKVALGNYLLKS